jgi:pimeloyl-ACP methyl ester carboxylesterase
MSHLWVGNKQLEYTWFGPDPAESPTLVFLHEGLGCVAMWRDFPQRVAAQTGCGALVYSRAGYGESDPAALPREVRFMHEEALTVLPRVLEAMAIRETVLVGHSDGGSIALIYAGGTRDSRVRGVILEAPHVFVEEVGIESIRAIAGEYRGGQLRQRLERYHGTNVDDTFWGWNRVWLDPAFRSWNIEEYLPQIRASLLVIQGEDDQYGTMSQIDAIKNGCRVPMRTVVLPDCGHSPHVDQPERTLEAITSFLRERGTV